MSDLDQLTRFDSGPGAPMLPAAEVRRRGDRLRRRRTGMVAGGAVLAVALAVSTPTLLRSGDSAHVVQPTSPGPSPSAGVTWITSVPADFPLTDGFPTPAEETAKGLVPTCGTGLPTPIDFVDKRVIRYAGESENTAQRMLLLFADDAAARDELAQLKGATTACAPVPLPGGAAETVVNPVVTDHVAREADDTYVFAEQVHHDDGLVSDLTLVEVSRTGNALFFDSRYTSAGGGEVITEELDLMEKASRVALASLCVFGSPPCQG